MTIRPIFWIILAAVGYPLLSQGINSVSAQAVSQGVAADSRYSMDAQVPLPFVAAEPTYSSACGDGCETCDSCDGCDSCGACDSHSGKCSCLSKWKFDWSTCRVYGAIDYLLLDRTNDSYDRPLVVNANSGDSLFSTSKPEFDYESGFRATIGIGHVGYCCFPAWELTYFGVYDWSDSTTVRGNDDLSLAGDLGFVVNGFTLAERIRTDYEAQFNSAEVNYFGCLYEYCCGGCFRRIEWLVGPRYLSLDEDLAVLGNNVNVANASYTVDTDNDLYGAQGGGRIRWFNCNWGWEFVGKAGVFGNDASQSQTIVDELGVNDVVLRNAGASDSTTAFVGELGLSGLARLTCNCSMRFGYNVFWVDGVALAPDQLDFSDTPDSGTSVASNGNTFMHGFNIGLECGW